jgi:puromycin-sensitive aminopeptidase
LSQERFFASPISKMKVNDKTLWQVPVQVQNSSYLLSKKSLEINILQKSWLKINLGESGFFRTAYSKDMLDKLKMPVEKKLLSARDRLGIIRDLFALSEAGTIPTTDALEFLSAYKNEDNYTVWVEIASGLARLEQLLAKTPLRPKLNKLSLKLFSPLAHKLGWAKRKNEDHADALLRPLAIGRAGRAGDKKIINETKKKFSLMRKGKPVNPDIRGAVYGVIAATGGMKEYKILVQMYKKETLHEEKNRIGGALGDFSSLAILRLAAEFALSKNVRPQDTVGILSSVGINPLGRDIWLKYIKQNWKLLVARYGDGGLTLARTVKAISNSAEEKHVKDFKKFFRTHDIPGAKRAVEQVIERLEGNILWFKRDKEKIYKFLK